MENEIDNDGFFSERSYDAANQLATVIGPVLTSISNGTEPDWATAKTEIAHREMLAMMFGVDAPIYIKTRIGAFLLMKPLIQGKVKEPMSWKQYLDDVCDLFPAYNAEIIAGNHPEYTRAEAETYAYLQFEGNLDKKRREMAN